MYYSEHYKSPISRANVMRYFGVDPENDATTALRARIYPLTDGPAGFKVSHYVKEGYTYRAVPKSVSILEQEMLEILEFHGSSPSSLRTTLGDFDTYFVTVEDKTTSHPYNGQGSSKGYYLDGDESPTLNVAVGDSIVFDQSDPRNATHPINIYTTADKAQTASGTIETTGTAGSSGAQVKFVPNTAGTYYYMCQAHEYMGGSIVVTN